MSTEPNLLPDPPTDDKPDLCQSDLPVNVMQDAATCRCMSFQINETLERYKKLSNVVVKRSDLKIIADTFDKLAVQLIKLLEIIETEERL